MRRLLLVTTALVAAAEPAQAGPVVAAFAWVGSTIAAGGILGAVVQMVVGFALNAVAAALMKPDVPGANVQFDVQMGDDQPLSFTVGEYATAGKRKYLGSWGRNTRFITEVIEYSALPQGLAGIWVDDERGEFVAGQRGYILASDSPNDVRDQLEAASVPGGGLDIGQPLTNYADDGNRIYVKWVAGNQSAADPFLVWAFGTDPDYPWTADMIGTGKSYAIITTRYDDDSLTGYPQYLIEPEPLPMYDLRLDSTNGGSGAHRWNNPATWAPTTNPAVIAYNIARGIYFGSEWVYGGKNLAAWRLPAAEWIAAANECDDAVSLAGGGTEPRYRCGMDIRCNVPAADALEEIGKAANMRFAETGGQLKPIVGLPAAAAFAFTDDDIVITEGQSFKPFYPVAETFNSISATYPEPVEKWSSKDAREYIDTDATAEDGGRYLPTSMTYGAVPFRRQVRRLMRSQMRDYRRMRRHQFHLPPDAYAIEPGVDMVSWTSQRNGYVSKLFMVESVAKTPGMMVLVSLREVDPGDYDWSSSFESPVTITVPKNPVRFNQVINGLTVTPAAVEDEESNQRRPAILVACDGDETGVTHIQIEARVAGSAQVVIDTERRFSAPHAWYLLNVLPATQYEVRARLISDLTPRSQWSGWLTVTTPDLGFSWIDFEDGVRQAVDDAMAEAQAAAEAAIEADGKAQAVREDHDALVGDFVGNLMDLEAADEGIQQRMDLLELSVSNTSYIRQTDGEDGSGGATVGGWVGLTGAAAPTSGPEVPPGQTGRSITVSAPGAYEPPYYSGASINGMVFRLRGWVQLNGGGTGRVAVVGSTLGNGPGGQTILAQSDPITGDWQQIDLQFTVGVDTDEWAPAFLVTGGSMRFWRVRLEDYSAAASLEASINANAQAIVDEATARVSAISNLRADMEDGDDSLSGSIDQITGLEVSALSGTALGVLLTQLNVNSGGTSATITQQGSAIVDLEDNASAGYLIKAQAGGAVSLIDLIAADGSGDEPTSIIKMDAQQIIATGTISAPMLVIQDPTNIVPDNQFKSSEAWGIGGPFSIVSNQGGFSSDGCIRYTNTGGIGWTAYRAGLNFSADQETEYYCECRANSGSGPYNINVQIVWVDGSGNSISADYIAPGSGVDSNMTLYTRSIVSPSGTKKAYIRYRVNESDTQGNINIGDIVVRAKQPGATLIKPNSIATPLLVTNAVTSEKINVIELVASSAFVNNLTVGRANIQNAAINFAKIDDLAVGRIKIADGAVTEFPFSFTAGDVTLSPQGTWVNIQTVVFSRGRPDPLPLFIQVQQATTGGSTEYRLRRNSTVVWASETLNQVAGEEFSHTYVDSTTSTGSVTYRLDARCVAPTSTGYLRNRFLGGLNAFK